MSLLSTSAALHCCPIRHRRSSHRRYSSSGRSTGTSTTRSPRSGHNDHRTQGSPLRRSRSDDLVLVLCILTCVSYSGYQRGPQEPLAPPGLALPHPLTLYRRLEDPQALLRTDKEVVEGDDGNSVE